MRKLVVFSGVGCQSCTVLKNILEAEFTSFEEKNILKNMAEAKELGVKSLPTSVIYEDGKVIEVIRGVNVDQIMEVLYAN